jgi:hypothetical protein
MTQQVASDIHHYDERLTAALANLENDKTVLDTNRKKIKQFLEYIRAEGLSLPRQVRYTYVLRKLSSELVQSWGGPIREIWPGDVVWIPPGEKHWHGAKATTAMTHIAVQEQLNGKAADWMEKVSDELYQAASSGE